MAFCFDYLLSTVTFFSLKYKLKYTVTTHNYCLPTIAEMMGFLEKVRVPPYIDKIFTVTQNLEEQPETWG